MAITTDVRRQLGRVKRKLRSVLADTPSQAPAEESAEVPAAAPRGPQLTPEQQAQWRDGGFVVLPQFFDPDRLDSVLAKLDDLWAHRSVDDEGLVIDVFIDTPHERRVKFRDASDEARRKPYKLNDLFLVSDEVRELILDAALVDVLDELLDGAPIVCNSLSFERGSQQRFHFDTFYMPPPVEHRMVASWIALEDADARSGPLRYYPGSHKLAPYRFSDGRLNANLAEMPDFDDYIDKQLADAGLDWTTFVPRQGDVFIWHAQLYHGGAPIDDMELTRKSLVTHYFRAQDMDPAAVEDIGGGRYYLRREHQATG